MKNALKKKLQECKLYCYPRLHEDILYLFGRFNAQIHPKQDVSDKVKMSWIEIEFMQSFVLNIVNVAHLGALIYSRGFSFCIWDSLFIGKAFF